MLANRVSGTRMRGRDGRRKCCLGEGAVRLSGPGACSHRQVQEGGLKRKEIHEIRQKKPV
jgi:hypothetical protein